MSNVNDDSSPMTAGIVLDWLGGPEGLGDSARRRWIPRTPGVLVKIAAASWAFLGLLLSLMAAPSAEAVEHLGMVVEKNTAITMRDGSVLAADVFRPIPPGRYPALLSHGPYNKDHHWQPPSDIDHADNPYMNWETVNPVWWVQNGYAVVRVDARGTGKSRGSFELLSSRQAQDFYDAIEWSARQPWSNGKIGTIGDSYYALSQWLVAEQRPPSLAAMIPWNGFSDVYRDAAYHGGILSTNFLERWWQLLEGRQPEHPDRLSGRSRMWPLRENARANPMDTGFYDGRRADPRQIEVPLLSAANWGGHGLHMRGNVEAFVQAESAHKKLLLHTRSDLQAFYSEEGRSDQKRFFDYWLKGIDNGVMDEPPIKIAVRSGGDEYEWRMEREWPLARTVWTKFYLSPKRSGAFSSSLNDGSLVLHPPEEEHVQGYDAGAKPPFEGSGPLVQGPPSFAALLWRFDENGDDELQPEELPEEMNYFFSAILDRDRDGSVTAEEAEHMFGPDPGALPYLFGRAARWLRDLLHPVPDPWADALSWATEPLEEDIEITGPVNLVLWVSSSTSDMDIFATVRDINPDGEEVLVWSPMALDSSVAKGWLRVSHRKTDPDRSRFYRPFHTHDDVWPLDPGEVVQVQVEILPTSMIFKKGHRILLDIQAGDSYGAGFFTHDNAPRRVGENRVHTGGDSAGYLLLPVIPHPGSIAGSGVGGEEAEGKGRGGGGRRRLRQ